MFDRLESERSQIKFDPKKISYILSGLEESEYQKFLAVCNSIPNTFDPNLFNYSRVDQMKLSIKELPKMNRHIDLTTFYTQGATLLKSQFQLPGSIHLTMFIACIKILGSDPQGERLLGKCASFQIIGCYAQTELGHGSDVQGLQTTATLDIAADQFILNTPSISAAKYWPGDLGCFANYALIFAKMIIKDVDHGVQAFLVQIRDKDGQPKPGIEMGDLGPKFGFMTKDNGYMILNNVRTHRKNMLRRYAKVEKDGSFTLRGNQKISYATMMLVRKLISTNSPKVFGIGLKIAGRYSMARKQFLDDKKQEITVIDYQLQQDKIISCLADYYAISIGGVKISKMTQINFISVSQKDDDSLMKETHNCLCLTKAFNSQVSNRDLEICRLACGGHGFSHYSGLPHLCQAYSANVTYEGQNTVMYLQVARFLMKSYKYTFTKKKELEPSVQYLNSMEGLLGKQCEVKDVDGWNLHQLQQLLAQSMYYFISTVGQKMADDAIPQKDIWNYKAGMRLYQTARCHARHWTYVAFVEEVQRTEDRNIKDALEKVCLLFGVNMIFQSIQGLIEGAVLLPNQVTSLKLKKQQLLKELRVILVGLIDAIDMPQDCLKSDLVSGDVYKKLFERAKKNPVNQGISPAVDILKHELTNCRPRM